MLSEKSKETYYEALKDSSTEWHNSDNDYLPFVKYYLGVVLKGYNEFEDRVEYMRHVGMSKPDRVKAVFDRKLGKITKADIVGRKSLRGGVAMPSVRVDDYLVRGVRVDWSGHSR